MKPFSSEMTESNSRLSLVLTVVPFVIIGLVVWFMLQNSPPATFKNYQEALRTHDWEEVLASSDETTHAYLASLEQWIWSATRGDLEELDAFQQFLVLTSRCEIIAGGMDRPDHTELFAIWIEALDIKELIISAKIVNRYNFGAISIGQLFTTVSNSNTGRQIRFTKEDDWKIQTITLMKEVYDSSGNRGNFELLKERNADYFEKGFASQHLKPLKTQPNVTHTL